MKFGVTIPNNWGQEDPQQVLAFGPLAEELDYDSVWVMDHLFNNGYIRDYMYSLRPGIPKQIYEMLIFSRLGFFRAHPPESVQYMVAAYDQCYYSEY